MMIPPVVRLGVPQIAEDGVAIILTAYGWDIVEYGPRPSTYTSIRQGSMNVYHSSEIHCWMPQDGS